MRPELPVECRRSPAFAQLFRALCRDDVHDRRPTSVDSQPRRAGERGYRSAHFTRHCTGKSPSSTALVLILLHRCSSPRGKCSTSPSVSLASYSQQRAPRSYRRQQSVSMSLQFRPYLRHCSIAPSPQKLLLSALAITSAQCQMSRPMTPPARSWRLVRAA